MELLDRHNTRETGPNTFLRPILIFLHSAYPLGLESLGSYPLGLALGLHSCGTSYVWNYWTDTTPVRCKQNTFLICNN